LCAKEPCDPMWHFPGGKSSWQVLGVWFKVPSQARFSHMINENNFHKIFWLKKRISSPTSDNFGRGASPETLSLTNYALQALPNLWTISIVCVRVGNVRLVICQTFPNACVGILSRQCKLVPVSGLRKQKSRVRNRIGKLSYGAEPVLVEYSVLITHLLHYVYHLTCIDLE